MEMTVLLPMIDFSDEMFLKIYYNIFSLESAIDWIYNNKHLPYYTIKRILDASFNSFNMNESILNDQLLDIFMNIIKKYWIIDIYKEIKNYIHVDNNKQIYLKKNSDEKDKFKIEKINFIIEKFVTYDSIQEILTKYIEKREKDELNLSHLENIKNSLIKFIKNKILSTIEK